MQQNISKNKKFFFLVIRKNVLFQENNNPILDDTFSSIKKYICCLEKYEKYFLQFRKRCNTFEKRADSCIQ